MSRFSNPLLPRDGADPFLIWNDGEYFLSVTRGKHLSFYRAPTLAGLRDAQEQIFWSDSHPQRCTEIWAPEFFHLDGRWWCYYTASDGKGRHRMWVLRGHETDLGGPWEFGAQLKTDEGDALYAIDLTVIQSPRGRFAVWAGHPGHRLFISPMESPSVLGSERMLLEASGFGCPDIREGPFCLRRNGRIFLIYSACDARSADYKLGMLSADENADLMDAASWTQHPDPVFTRNDRAKVYGPGHHCFFKSPDGTQDWMAYHAKKSRRWTFTDRVPCAMRITWNEDGTPNLGTPPAFGEEQTEPS
ncbi:extracellular exo-alpha-(1-_5)-L-arabinofuranosidase [Abditibacteriota bacterium]|nr:extracellular exo-alpha-(1->5)-L-arabinofuranosidase [Abditibacteriota bacterium]